MSSQYVGCQNQYNTVLGLFTTYITKINHDTVAAMFDVLCAMFDSYV